MATEPPETPSEEPMPSDPGTPSQAPSETPQTQPDIDVPSPQTPDSTPTTPISPSA